MKPNPPSNNKGQSKVILTNQRSGNSSYYRPPKIIKTRITKGETANKDRVKDPMPPAKARDKAGHEARPPPFDGKGGNKDGADKTGQAQLLLKLKLSRMVCRSL